MHLTRRAVRVGRRGRGARGRGTGTRAKRGRAAPHPRRRFPQRDCRRIRGVRRGAPSCTQGKGGHRGPDPRGAGPSPQGEPPRAPAERRPPRREGRRRTRNRGCRRARRAAGPAARAPPRRHDLPVRARAVWRGGAARGGPRRGVRAGAATAGRVCRVPRLASCQPDSRPRTRRGRGVRRRGRPHAAVASPIPRRSLAHAACAASDVGRARGRTRRRGAAARSRTCSDEATNRAPAPGPGARRPRSLGSPPHASEGLCGGARGGVGTARSARAGRRTQRRRARPDSASEGSAVHGRRGRRARAARAPRLRPRVRPRPSRGPAPRSAQPSRAGLDRFSVPRSRGGPTSALAGRENEAAAGNAVAGHAPARGGRLRAALYAHTMSHEQWRRRQRRAGAAERRAVGGVVRSGRRGRTDGWGDLFALAHPARPRQARVRERAGRLCSAQNLACVLVPSVRGTGCELSANRASRAGALDSSEHSAHIASPSTSPGRATTRTAHTQHAILRQIPASHPPAEPRPRPDRREQSKRAAEGSIAKLSADLRRRQATPRPSRAPKPSCRLALLHFSVPPPRFSLSSARATRRGRAPAPAPNSPPRDRSPPPPRAGPAPRPP